jgi:hypothetical protein
MRCTCLSSERRLSGVSPEQKDQMLSKVMHLSDLSRVNGGLCEGLNNE